MDAVKRGSIFHRFFTTTTPPKDKFFVVVGEDGDDYVGYFFINSNINRFIERNQAMYDMQMPLLPRDYSFLDHQSYIDGSKLSKLNKSILLEELANRITTYKGRLKGEDIIRLISAVQRSPLFSAKEKKCICGNSAEK